MISVRLSCGFVSGGGTNVGDRAQSLVTENMETVKRWNVGVYHLQIQQQANAKLGISAI